MPRYRRVQTISHDIGVDGSLFLSVTSADVRLTATDGTEALLRATFEVDAPDEAEADRIFESGKMTADATTGQLNVAEADGSWGMGSKIDRLVRSLPYLTDANADLEEVTGTAPAGCRIEVRAVSGDVQATGFLGSQRFQSVSGDLRLSDGGGDLDIESVSGDVSLRAVEPATMKVNTVSGDLSAEAPRFDRIKANAVSGDLSLDGALGASEPHAMDTVSGDVRLASNSGMTVSVRGLASDFHSSLPHRLEGSADRRRMIVGDGAASVTFNSMSGDLAVTRSKQAGAPPVEAAKATPTPAPAASGDDRLTVLGALERGEIDVDEAMRRLGDAG